MKHTNKLLKAFGSVGVGLFIQLALQGNATAQFFDDFSSTTLDPAWEMRAYTGPFPRSHGIFSPANRFSLIGNPGYLRYYLDPMTHGDGFLNNYQTAFGFYSCCNHDMVLHFKTQQTGIQCGDTDATLTGTTNGQNITGTDAIQTVGCSSPKAVAEGETEVSSPEGFALYQNYPNLY